MRPLLLGWRVVVDTGELVFLVENTVCRLGEKNELVKDDSIKPHHLRKLEARDSYSLRPVGELNKEFFDEWYGS